MLGGLFSMNSLRTAMGRPHSDLVLPTTKHERMLGLSTLSYKLMSNLED